VRLILTPFGAKSFANARDTPRQPGDCGDDFKPASCLRLYL